MVPEVLPPAEIARLLACLDGIDDPAAGRRGGALYAARNLLVLAPAVAALASAAPIRALVEPVLGNAAFPVRGLLFDKTPQANWKVPWHQDRTIAVARRRDAAGFGPWTMKAGIVHVEPPVEILQRMLAVRLHLDASDAANGPLRVIAGSHALGRLTAAQVRHEIEAAPSITCLVPAGGALLMRPLLLHASSAARSPRHRRVIHLEFASCALPGGLAWSTDKPSAN